MAPLRVRCRNAPRQAGLQLVGSEAFPDHPPTGDRKIDDALYQLRQLEIG